MAIAPELASIENAEEHFTLRATIENAPFLTESMGFSLVQKRVVQRDAQRVEQPTAQTCLSN